MPLEQELSEARERNASRLGRILKNQGEVVALNQRYPRLQRDFQSILSLQVEADGKCMICGDSQTGRKLAIDHCHQTGKMRGVLCHHCNVGLGHFRDNPDLLLAAINYLKQYG